MHEMGSLDDCKNRAVVILFFSELSPRHTLILSSLKKRGWDISIVAWDRGGNRSSLPSDNFSLFDRWHWIRVPAAVWSWKIIASLPLYYFRLWKTVSRFKKPDLWLLTHFFLLPISPLLPGQRIYDAAEMFAIDISLYFGPLRHVAQSFISFFERLLVTRMDGVLTVDSRKGWLEEFYKRSNRIVQVIWNVPSMIDDPKDGDIEYLREWYVGRKVVAFVGGLMKEKGLRVALEAAALAKSKYPESLFLFIGPIKDDSRAINNLIEDKGIKENVRFLDPMPYKEMLAHLRHAQIGLALHQQSRIYPYVSAGNGRKFFTYMQAGVAIIGPRFGEVGKIVKITGCGLLVGTERAEAVAEAIDYLFSHPEERQRMADNGRKAFLERFNWEIEEKKFLSFLNQVMSRKRGTI